MKLFTLYIIIEFLEFPETGLIFSIEQTGDLKNITLELTCFETLSLKSIQINKSIYGRDRLGILIK